MSRKQSPALLVATLGVGVLLGLNLAWKIPAVRPLAAGPNPAPAADPGPREADARDDAAIYQQIDRQYALFEPVNRAFELVAKAVSPSVVHIVAHKVGRRDEDGRSGEFEESGSGVIVRGDGGRGLFVLTNYHVVSGAEAIDVQIFLNDGRSLRPEKIWNDSRADVAVLKIARDDLPAARLGDSDRVAVGTWVMAIGSPFGLTHSVSQGIISGRGRHETDLEDLGVENQDFLQTDAAINPGNSGGPLVNLRGEVIGLNIAILSNHHGSEGVGFTIPINIARWIMNSLITTGRVDRGALGVKLRPEFLHEHAVALGLDRPRGAWVAAVDKASPAAAAGVRVDDVILRFNGHDVADLNQLINIVSMSPIGRPAEVVVWRDRVELPLRVIVADKDRGPYAATNPPRRSAAPTGNDDPAAKRRANPPAPAPETRTIFGLELVTLDARSGPRLGLPVNIAGAVVTKVEPTSPLATYFRPLDVISTVGARPIRDADEAVKALSGRADQDHLDLGLLRLTDGVLRTIKVRLP